MSEKNHDSEPTEPTTEAADPAELNEDQLEDVAGGIIEGGCTEPVLRPWEIKPTF